MLELTLSYRTAGGRCIPLAGSDDADFVHSVARGLIDRARRRAEQTGGAFGDIERADFERLAVMLGIMLVPEPQEEETTLQ